MVNIFISYKRDRSSWVYLDEKDSVEEKNNPNRYKPLIQHLINAFKKRADIYYDKEKIVGGDRFDKIIRSMIDSADIVILLISKEFCEPGYVLNTEWPYTNKVYNDGKVILFPIYITPLPRESVTNLKKMLPDSFANDIELATTNNLYNRFIKEGEVYYSNIVINEVIDSLSSVIDMCQAEQDEYAKIIKCINSNKIKDVRVEDCQAFIDKYKNSKYLNEVKKIKQELTDRITVDKLYQSFTVKKLINLIESEPENVYIDELNRRLVDEHNRAYKVINNSDPESFIFFAENFPKSIHIKDVLDRYYDMIKRESDKLFKKVKKSDISLADRLDIFVDTYTLINDPKSDNIILDIANRRDKLMSSAQSDDDIAFAVAAKIGTKESYKEYINMNYTRHLDQAYNSIAKLTKVDQRWYKTSWFYGSMVALIIALTLFFTIDRKASLQYPDINEIFRQEMLGVFGDIDTSNPLSRKYDFVTTTDPKWFCKYCDSLSSSDQPNIDKIKFITKTCADKKAIGYFNLAIDCRNHILNRKVSIKWMEMAKELGYPAAITELAIWKQLGNNYKNVYSKYIKEFEAASEGGDAKAAYICYRIYLEHFNDKEKANSFLIQSAMSGYDYAIEEMITIKMNTDSVYRSLKEIYRGERYILRYTQEEFRNSMRYLALFAYEAGDYELCREVATRYSFKKELMAIYGCGIGVDNDYTKVLELAKDTKDSDMAKALAHYNLNKSDSSLIYLEKWGGKEAQYIDKIVKIEQCDTLAKRQAYNDLLTKKELRYNYYAQLYLACSYLNGNSYLDRDNEQTIKLLNYVKNSRASDLCKIYALYNLGVIYHYGLCGEDSDPEYANTFFYRLKDYKLYNSYKDLLVIP